MHGVVRLQWRVGYFAGTATAEGYATDSVSGTLLWQIVDKRGGTTALVENTFDSWLDVHHAFKTWSTQLLKALQADGICRKWRSAAATSADETRPKAELPSMPSPN